MPAVNTFHLATIRGVVTMRRGVQTRCLGHRCNVRSENAADNVTQLVVPNAGHWLMEEAPDTTISTVRNFIDGKPIPSEDSESTARH